MQINERKIVEYFANATGTDDKALNAQNMKDKVMLKK